MVSPTLTHRSMPMILSSMEMKSLMQWYTIYLYPVALILSDLLLPCPNTI